MAEARPELELARDSPVHVLVEALPGEELPHEVEAGDLEAAIYWGEGRLRSQVLPVLGKLPIAGLRPHHVRDLVVSLRAKKSGLGGVFGPRTVRHISATLHHVLHDAMVDEILPANPCVLKRGELPRKADKDPIWRSGEFFISGEVESLFSDERIPEDLRRLRR